MKNSRPTLLAILAVIFLTCVKPATASPDGANGGDAMLAAKVAAKGDPILDALLAEMERSKAQLKMDQLRAPYYLEYRVSDVEDFVTEAAFGATREDQKVHVRLLRVLCRSANTKRTTISGKGSAGMAILHSTTVRMPFVHRF